MKGQCLCGAVRFEVEPATYRGIQVCHCGKCRRCSSGRQQPEEVRGSDYTEPADLAIQALGFEPEEIVRLWGVEGLEVTRWGTVKADFRTHETSLPGVYAAGDIVRGASLVVWAIRDGREAADAIAERLTAGATAIAAE